MNFFSSLLLYTQILILCKAIYRFRYLFLSQDCINIITFLLQLSSYFGLSMDVFSPVEKVASSILIDYSAFSSEALPAQTAAEKPKATLSKSLKKDD